MTRVTLFCVDGIEFWVSQWGRDIPRDGKPYFLSAEFAPLWKTQSPALLRGVVLVKQCWPGARLLLARKRRRAVVRQRSWRVRPPRMIGEG